MKNYLNFENEIKNIELEIDRLKDPYNNEGISTVDTDKIDKLQSELDKKLKEIYSNLNPWQTTLVARHENRPKSKFFIDNLFDNFFPLSGDRLFGEDKSSLAGLANFEGQSVMVIGQEKGDDLESRIERNFGMMKPEGYRKSIRLMKIADKFGLPVIIFIDTPGAYPGVGAEERGQAEAIAKSIECSLSLSVPTISVIIGEGGSGGAIALASSNKILMFENAIYSVISPEGCASILWRDPKKTLEAATAMKLTSNDLLELKIIDEIILEPSGGAHRDRDKMLKDLRKSISRNLGELTVMSRQDVMEQRKKKYLNIGRDKGLSNPTLSSNELFNDSVSKFFDFRNQLNKKKYYIIILIFVIFLSLYYLI